MDKWAWQVLDMAADIIEASGGSPAVINEMLRKEGKKIIKALLILIRPEHRERMVKWLERITAII